MPTRRVQLSHFGRLDYPAGLRWQDDAARTLANDGLESLALLEHDPVYTLGVRSEPAELLRSADAIRAAGAELVTTDRGGRTTFHGPGQLVVYPVLDLRARGLGPVDYVRRLEALVIAVLADLGIAGGRAEGRPGVWVDGAKIASVGVRVRGGISRHGVALNVATDLTWFDAIVPCGLAGVEMTSVERCLGAAPPLSEVADAGCTAFESLFESRLVAAGAAVEPEALVAAW